MKLSSLLTSITISLLNLSRIESRLKLNSGKPVRTFALVSRKRTSTFSDLNSKAQVAAVSFNRLSSHNKKTLRLTKTRRIIRHQVLTLLTQFQGSRLRGKKRN